MITVALCVTEREGSLTKKRNCCARTRVVRETKYHASFASGGPRCLAFRVAACRDVQVNHGGEGVTTMHAIQSTSLNRYYGQK